MAPPSADPEALAEEIDNLLMQYLGLLNRYHELRAKLIRSQKSVCHCPSLFRQILILFPKVQINLARARFNTDRGGIRYGPDCYDLRMQAEARCRVTIPSENEDSDGADKGTSTAAFTVSLVGEEQGPEATDSKSSKDNGIAVPHHNRSENVEKEKNGEGEQNEDSKTENTSKGGSEEEKTKARRAWIKDPITMFGVMPPPVLKVAQSEAIDIVEDIIPMLASVDLEMRATELKIRQHRKYKTKAERPENKKGLSEGRREALVAK